LEIINWIIAAISVPIIIFLVQLVRRRARQLNARIEEYHAEQEAAKSKPSHVNPYADLAALFNADPSAEQKE
jgi:hypothetical protein